MSGLPDRPRRHPDAATLLAQAAGGLDRLSGLVVETHLAFCPECRGTARLGRRIGGALLDALLLAPLADGALEHTLARLEAGSDAPPVLPVTNDPGPGLPGPLRHLVAGRSRWVGPGIRCATLLREGEGHLGLLQVAAGASIPPHRHRGTEMICVLEGAFTDGAERYAAGDFSAASGDHHHSQRAETPGGCVCLIATQGRLRFGTLLSRLWQPFMPF